jgi:hypothetical protein
MTEDVFIRVVLCGCQGKGADPNSFRPQAHDKQWWGRRDALVRCVTAFLFGPSTASASSSASNNNNNSNGRELVLIFDEDRARIHMTITSRKNNSWNSMMKSAEEEVVPTEQTILRIWKRAAQPQNLGQQIQQDGIQCRVVVDPTLEVTAQLSNFKQKRSAGPSITKNLVGSKRQILEHIQKRCPLDFLKEKKLNASADVVLRKVNRDSLLKIWSEYSQQFENGSRPSSSPSAPEEVQKIHCIQSIYKDLLELPDHLPKSTRIVAGTLHESCDEFPCFNTASGDKDDNADDDMTSTKHRSDSKSPLLLCLFLGAVRDMTPAENDALQKACNTNSQIPVVGIRFGTVAEFTSKILSILAFHHARNVVRPSIDRQLKLLNKNRGKEDKRTTNNQLQKLKPTCLNVVVVVPMISTQVSTSLDRRDRRNWCLVRVIVTTLWRSRMVSSSSGHTVSHTNKLHLIFDDGVCISLSETEFVRKLASQHEAAPSEFQILKALVEKIEDDDKSKSTLTKSNPASDSKPFSTKKSSKHLINDIFDTSPVPVTCAISLQPTGGSEELVDNFYNALPSSGHLMQHFGVLLVMDIASSIQSSTQSPNGEKIERSKMFRAIMSTMARLNKQGLSQIVVSPPSCLDVEGASIMALQHFCYQNRVFHGLKQHCKRKHEEST